jgi:hypothetical protein
VNYIVIEPVFATVRHRTKVTKGRGAGVALGADPPAI